tara:strand:- start:38540 stop:39865 length:1326 start_codon:yes stop_codon:yes gene_type:complete
MPEEILSPGHFIVNSIKLFSSTGAQQEITNVYTELNIHESITKGWVSGRIMVIESLGLQNLFPLIGAEFIEIRYKTPSVDDEVILRASVIAIESRRQIKDNVDGYDIRFISSDLVQNSKFKVKTTYKNTPHSDAVQIMCGEFFEKPLVVNEPSRSTSFSLCNMTPFSAIQWLAARTKSKRYSGANYVFFEKLGESPGFVFSSIENLIDPDFIVPVTTYDRSVGNVEPASRKNVQQGFNSIDRIRFLNEPNTALEIQEGMFASSLSTFDPVTGRYNRTKFNYFASYDNYKHLNGNKKEGQGLSSLHNDVQLGSQSDSVVSLGAKHYGMYESGVGNVEDYHLLRRSQMAQMGILPGGIQMEIQVAGDSRRSVGEVVALKLPRAGVLVPGNDLRDRYYSGNYLVTALRHQVSPPRDNQTQTLCKTTMVLATDSYATPLPVAAHT